MDDVSSGPLTDGRPAAWRREATALALQARLIAAGWWRRPQALAGERVAVFVHGFLAAGPVFDPLREHVTRTTGVPGIHFTYSPVASFERTVHGLAEFIDARVPDGARVALVGHSLGGVVARWYVQELGGHARVDRLVTLATPHAGTDKARAWPLSLAKALRPEGEVMRRLEQRAHVLGSLPLTAVAAGEDRMVQPPASAAAVRHGRVVWLPDVGHNELLYDPRVHRIVAEAVRADR